MVLENSTARRRAVAVAFAVLTGAAASVRLAAQHGTYGMEGEHGPGSGQTAAIARELAASAHTALGCSDCHGEMEMGMGERGVDPVLTCGSCHARALVAYRPSVHAVAVRRGAPHAPTCVTCHGSHAVRPVADPRAAVSRSRLAEETCARCHEPVRVTAMHGLPADVVPDYRESFHGLSAALGDERVANCASCHGSHEIRPSRDPRSTVNPANLSETCGACHPGAAPGFASGGVHHRPDTPGHRLVDVVETMYVMMISAVVGLMLAHNALDFWGRWRERRARRRDARRVTTSG